MSGDIATNETLSENGYAYKHFQKISDHYSYRSPNTNPVKSIKSWDLDPPYHSDLLEEYYSNDQKYDNTIENDHNIITDTETMANPYNNTENYPTRHNDDLMDRNAENYDNMNSVLADPFLTSYNDDYKPSDMFHNEDPIMPHSLWESPSDADLLENTYQDNYQPYQLDKVSNYKPKEFYLPPQEPMDTNTTYSIDYPPRYSRMEKSYKPHEVYVPPTIPISNMTTYQSEYKDPPWSPREMPFRMKDNETFPKGRFQSETSYFTDYPPKEAQPVHCFKPYREYRMPTEPMSGQTNYQTDYTFQPYSKPKSYSPMYVYQQPKIPFHKNTSYSEEFQPHLVSKPKSFTPVYEYRKPRTKMEDTTAYSSDYRPWQIKRDDPFYPKDNLRLLHANNEMVTSYMDEFPPRYAHKLNPIKQKETRWLSDEALSSQTTYLTDFRPVTPKPSMSYKPKEFYRSPSVPVVSQSSYAEEFIPRYSKKQDPVLPKTNLKVSKMPMDKTSSYSEEFQYRKAKKTENLKPVDRYKHPTVPFSGKTSYRTEFRPPYREYKNNQSCPPTTRYSYLHPTTKVNMTTYANDFRPRKTPSKLQPIVKEDNLKINYLINDDLKTSYSIDYVNYYEPYVNSYKKDSEFNQPSENIHIETTNSNNLLPKINVHNTHPKTTKNSPQTSDKQKVNNNYSNTTYHQEHTKLPPLQQTNQFRPQDYYVPPKVKMSNETTYSCDYKWPEFFISANKNPNNHNNLNSPYNHTDNNSNNFNQYSNNAEFTNTDLSKHSYTVAENSNVLPNMYPANNNPDFNDQNNNGALGKFMDLMSQNRTDE
ncbi:unnamed protein product [Schistosoma turkestanicum]|nr:unnamed protein product [Schistosoma turkestanicum]